MPAFDINGVSIYYEERGSGDPLLLIMGITASGAAWEKHAFYWEKDFRCIIADNRGAGLSDKPEGAYTTAQMSGDYAGLLQRLGIDKVRVVGCSMGSAIALQLALNYPDTVHSLVLMCPWARCDSTARAIFQHMMNCKAGLKNEEFSLFLQLLIYSKSAWDNSTMFNQLEEERKRAAVEPLPQPLHGLQGQAAACITHDVLKRLGEIKKPVLVIGGTDDHFTPAWMAEEVADAIPDAKLFLYEKSGHAFHWENIEDFNPRIRSWLISN